MRRRICNMKTMLNLWMLAVAVNVVIGMRQSSSGRTQYFLTNPDGSYQYAFDTNTGDFQEQQRGADGSVSGKYGFTGAGESSVNVQYTANGGSGGGGGAGYRKQEYQTSHHTQAAKTHSSGVGVGGGQGDYSLSLNPDGSYNYEYTLPDQAKAESRGRDGRVKGHFSFTDPTGQNRAIKYKADEGGFQAEGDHIPVAGGVQAAQFGSGHRYGGGLPSYGRGGSSYGGSSGGSGEYKLRLGPDGQYEYSYMLNDQAKSEARGGDGRVKGQFSYTGKDGHKKAISYTADERGFLAEGDHIPKPPQEFYDAHQKAARFGGSRGSGGSYSGGSGYDSYAGSSGQHGGSDGTYSFDYATHGHAHSQSASGGAVRGQYSVNTDGSRQKVSYSANGNQGFKPVVDFSGSVGGGIAGDGAYGKSRFSGSGLHGGQSHSSGHGDGGGAAYSFSYNIDDLAHSQTGSGGRVRGQYSSSSHGGAQKVVYDANGGTGFKPIVEVKTKVGAGGHAPGTRFGSGSGFSGSKFGSLGRLGLIGSTDHSGNGEAWSYQFTAGG